MISIPPVSSLPQLAFKAGCDETMLKAIQEQLMAMCQVRSLNELDNYGIFSNQIFVSPEFYLQGYNIVFHYNPYDIAPYSTGSIDVPVPYYTIRECLSPEVLRLLDINRGLGTQLRETLQKDYSWALFQVLRPY